MAQSNRCRVSAILSRILDLPRSNVANELGKLDWVAGTFKALLCHDPNIAQSAAGFIPAGFQTDQLSHAASAYPAQAAPGILPAWG